MPEGSAPSTAISRSRRDTWLVTARIACILLAATAIIYQWVRIMRAPNNDFDLHYLFAQHFIKGDFLYTLGFHWPYPPFWALAHTPFTLMSPSTAQVVYYPFGLLTVFGLIIILGRLMRRDGQRRHDVQFWTVMLAVLLCLRYLLRDGMELYINTTLVLLAWLSVYAWTKGRDWLGGACLGLAVALKMTAGLFIPYFLLKRQWKLAGSAILFAGLFTLSPMLRTGPTSYVEHMKAWSGRIVEGLSQKDPSVGVLGDEQFENMSLRSTLVRYLMDLPIGHAGRAPLFRADGSRETDRSHPGYVTILSLSPAATTWIIRLATLAMLLVVAWPMRKAPSGRDDPRIIWECAAVSLLLLVLSPITWGQHCVGVLPACLLISDRLLRGQRFRLWMMVLLSWYVLVVVILNRGIVGKSTDALFQSYHLETFAIIALLAVVMGWRRRVEFSALSSQPPLAQSS
ncbi:MAG: glycosyltransferase family 87 protein [Phycisphaeraceae bacterium]